MILVNFPDLKCATFDICYQNKCWCEISILRVVFLNNLKNFYQIWKKKGIASRVSGGFLSLLQGWRLMAMTSTSKNPFDEEASKADDWPDKQNDSKERRSSVSSDVRLFDE